MGNLLMMVSQQWGTKFAEPWDKTSIWNTPLASLMVHWVLPTIIDAEDLEVDPLWGPWSV